jgi:hypothetical protein
MVKVAVGLLGSIQVRVVCCLCGMKKINASTIPCSSVSGGFAMTSSCLEITVTVCSVAWVLQ